MSWNVYLENKSKYEYPQTILTLYGLPVQLLVVDSFIFKHEGIIEKNSMSR